MRRDLARLLVCPDDKTPLRLSVDHEDGDEIVNGALDCPECGAAYPIRDSIPNLLPRGFAS